jgi:mRNA interferase MazF
MSAPPLFPRRGEVWFGDLDPTEGREQGCDRPMLIVSVDRFDARGRDLVVAPLSSVRRGFVWHVDLDPPEGGVGRPSVVMVEQVRSISLGRIRRRVGVVSPAVLVAVEHRLRLLLGL